MISHKAQWETVQQSNFVYTFKHLNVLQHYVFEMNIFMMTESLVQDHVLQNCTKSIL